MEMAMTFTERDTLETAVGVLFNCGHPHNFEVELDGNRINGSKLAIDGCLRTWWKDVLEERNA